MAKIRYTFQNALEDLKSGTFSPQNARMQVLADLSAEKAAALEAVLKSTSPEQKRAFFRALEDCGAENYVYSFGPIGAFGILDDDGEVRRASIALLTFEDDRDTGTRILNAALHDDYEPAQAAAVHQLGQYMIELELEEKIPLPAKRLREALKNLLDHEKKAVRLAAVQAYAFGSDAAVKNRITRLLTGNDFDELRAGLIAARNSLENDWNRSVIELLEHDDEEIRMEAVRSAGQLGIEEALPAMYKILEDFDRVDRDLLLETVNAVAEIGYDGSLNVLEVLGEAAGDMDSEVTDAIDDAIDTLNVTIEMGALPPMPGRKVAKSRLSAALKKKLAEAEDHCVAVLEEKIPKDSGDEDEDEDDDHCDCAHDHEEHDECACGEEHHHHRHHEHNPLEGMDLSRFRIVENLEDYEKNADRDEEEETLWMDFEDMDADDLDADSLKDFMDKLEKAKGKSDGKSAK